MLYSVEIGSARTVLSFLIIQIVVSLVIGTRRLLIAAARITFAERELTRGENVLGCAQ